MPGRLILLPNLLHEDALVAASFPKHVFDVINELDGMIVEDEKAARRFLKNFQLNRPISEFKMITLSEHTKDSEIEPMLDPIIQGEVWGVVSEAGISCIADPGAKLVALAHRHEIFVDAMVGPCSLILALQLSGFSGQQFTFHGYLPREQLDRKKEILALELDVKKSRRTQIFIETPYRNRELMSDLLSTLSPSMQLCVAFSLMSKEQGCIVKTIREWKTSSFEHINKKPAVFLISN